MLFILFGTLDLQFCIIDSTPQQPSKGTQNCSAQNMGVWLSEKIAFGEKEKEILCATRTREAEVQGAEVDKINQINNQKKLLWDQLFDYNRSCPVNDVNEEPASNLKCSRKKCFAHDMPRSKITKFSSIKKPQFESNLLLPPSGRAQATTRQHKQLYLLPVAACGLSFGHVKLKTSYSKNYSEVATSGLCCCEWAIKALSSAFRPDW